ncbi:hypothetical protein WN944_025503 [Citrus x changshan-huyou]|uniref:glutathione transferase n=1 Tax=Citrus x changshan-huyou TaxID=2935761 RepID=A0AAP0QD07_9ROSI
MSAKVTTLGNRWILNQGPFASTWHASVGKEEPICCGLVASKESAIIETHQFGGPIRLWVIIGSFLAEGWKESRSGMQPEPLSSSMPKFIPGASAIGSPPSRGNLSESSGGPGSSLNHSTGGGCKRLSESKYLAGDDCTMADMQYIPYLVYFMRTPKAAAVTPRPRANAWWNDIASGMQLLKLQKA